MNLLPRLAVLALLVGPTSSLFAQNEDKNEDDVYLEEIVVTAEKRAATVMKTPLAISALDQDELERNGVARTEDLDLLVPNFKFGTIDVGFGGAQLTLRGISNDNITEDGDPSIAVHLDGVYLPRISSGNALFYDMARVEVLRGPQGTLYGRNTTSGTVNIIPNRPGFETDSAVSLGAGSYSLVKTEGFYNTPLIDDKLAFRVAFSYANHDGYRDNGPAPDGDDADDLGLRTSLLFSPTDQTGLLLTVDYFRAKGNGGVMAAIPFDRSSDPTGFQYPFVTDPNKFALNTDPYEDNNDWGVKLELTHDFGASELTWISAVRGHQRANRVDRDGTDQIPRIEDLQRFAGSFAGREPVVGPTTGNYAVVEMDSRAISSELRLASVDDGQAFNWLGGLYFFEETQDGGFDAFVEGLRGTGFIAPFLGMPPPAAAADPAVRVRRFNDKTAESIAAFGQASYSFGDKNQYRLTGGLRWTRDHKNDGNGTYSGFTLAPLTAPDAIYPEDRSFPIAGNAPVCDRDGISVYRCVNRTFDESWSELTWKAGFDWQVNDDWLLYTSTSRGFRSGGFNDGNIYAPEFNNAFEGGFKGRFPSGKAQLDVALFYYDLEDQQVSQVENATTITSNAGKSKLLGAEIAAGVLPYKRSRLDMTLGYLNTEYDRFVDVDDPQTPGVIPEDLSGNKFLKAPEWSLNLNWEPYTFITGAGGAFVPKIQFHYESDFYLLAFNNPQNLQESFTRTDFRLMYQAPSGRWSLEAWVRNIEDESVLAAQFTTPNPLLTPPQAVGFPPGAGREELLLGSYAPPRTYGLTFKLH